MRQQHNARFTAYPVLRFVACLVLALLQACQPSGPDVPFHRYLDKLAAALSISTPSRPPIAVLAPPLTATLQLAIPVSPIDKLDFLQLSGCAVQANIGKRQTSLGQHAKPSQRLFLELEYLRLAPECITRLRESYNKALADMLEAAWQEKQAQLPALIFNATLGSDEYRAFWLAVPAPGDYPRSNPEAVAAAMGAINEQAQRWLDGDYRVRNRDFEILLSEVAGGNGGTRLQEWSSQIEWLAASDLMLQSHLAVCSEHKRNAATHQHIATVHTYFTEVIQPLTNQSRLRYQTVITPVTTLETQLGRALPPIYQRWLADRNQQFTTLADAPIRHLTLLRTLQQACNTQ